MDVKLAVAALLVAPVAACGGATAAGHHAVARTVPRARPAADVVQQAAFADRSVFAAAALPRRRAEQREEAVEAQRLGRARERQLQQQAHSCPVAPLVHFDTAAAAMIYLAGAWNRHDLGAMCAVSTPDARYQLLAMHDEARNLRFSSCDSQGNGAYMCTFRHDYPARLHRHGHGEMQLIVAPATRPGWYTSGFIGCG